MMEKSISVIIPTRDRKELLRTTLYSILGQTLKPLEVLVVDDHSTDDSEKMIREEFSDSVSYLVSKGNGPGAARNMGFRNAKGEYVKFFDSDDVMTCNTLEEQFNCLQESGKDFAHSPYFFATQENGHWHPTDHVILNYHPPGSVPLWREMMIDSLFIPIPAMLFKRQLLERVGAWREDVVAYEDWDFLFRLSLLEGTPGHTNKCAFLYRTHSVQTTSGNFSDQQRDLDKAKVLKNLFENKIHNDQRFTRFEKLAFQNKLYQAFRVTPNDHPLKKELEVYNNGKHWMVWQWLRAKYKIGRLRTHSDWQPSHRSIQLQDVTRFYINLISLSL